MAKEQKQSSKRMEKKSGVIPVEIITETIRTIRGTRIILDSDLAQLYGVPTRTFNQAVKRNRKRFPADFLFLLTKEEWDSLRSQNVILKTGTGQHRKYTPFAFTEQGALMAANVLKSSRAIAMSGLRNPRVRQNARRSGGECGDSQNVWPKSTSGC